MPLKRPFGVTLLLWTVLILSAWGAVRLVTALREWSTLAEFGFRPGPLYLSITGAGWALAGGVLVWGMVSRRKWSQAAILIYLILWLAVYWLERVLLQSARASLPFAVTLSAVFLAVTLVCTLHRSTKKFLTRSEEHEQHKQDPTPA